VTGVDVWVTAKGTPKEGAVVLNQEAINYIDVQPVNLTGGQSVARAAGSGRAAGEAGPVEKAWRATQEHWREWKEREELIRSIANSNEAEAAFGLIFRRAKEGPTRLRALKRTVDAETFDAVVAVKLRELGERNGLFDGRTFLAEWGGGGRKGLDDAAKDVMAPPGSALRKGLDELSAAFRAEKTVEEVRGRFGFSGTPAGIEGTDLAKHPLLSIVTTPLKAVPGVGRMGEWAEMRVARRNARLLTDPEFVEWLAKGGKIKPRDKAGMAMHLSVLPAIAAANPERRDDIYDYVLQLGPRKGELNPSFVEGREIEPSDVGMDEVPF